MTKLQKHLVLLGCILTAIVVFAFNTKKATTAQAFTNVKPIVTQRPNEQKVQVAILLDVSGSMDGLIEQAKAQLWNMVGVLGKSKCGNGAAPKIEIALYEYGRTTNDAKKGYVKQINGFISDLDSLSENLFTLKTNGGDEYCGEVIFQSADDLIWDKNAQTYKVIFIAGNEDFLQGPRKFTDACVLAKSKNIVVNTIYCGDFNTGLAEHWKLAGECGNGTYSNINSNAKTIEFNTPYDSVLIAYNQSLNGTYIGYGIAGAAKANKQARMDAENMKASKEVALKRAVVKSNKAAYDNASWDLVDAATGLDGKVSGVQLANVSKASLPDSLKKLSNEQLVAFVNKKALERNAIQEKIKSTNELREAYIAEERKKMAQKAGEATLETAIEKSIKSQAANFGLSF
jgi:hypothetical protein